ncbi:hypothetical protein D0X99_19775 [Algoriphagus lacus]|uniref:Secreted protein n=1 Tax=Algoriphagus lacus TaxID=2056311 RepID=A0A418PLC6_9BACT|nr:DUF6520 family protein [Algoriphagus lacus]RIW12095.1 hypothetical protein D0X99_19775 [Algoriphagus lacus]
MRLLKKALPALALVLGATLAMAMNFASPVNNNPQYGTPDGGETWVVVNDPQNPVNYRCDIGTEACLYSQESLMHPIGSTDKQFVLIP